MRTVDHFARIRQRRRDGLTIRPIATRLGHSPKTLVKALADPEPPSFRTPPRPAPVFGPFAAAVDAIPERDRPAPREQRHTASQIFRRLVNERRYTGGYDRVRRHLKSRRLAARDTFVPLDHPPGHRREADFGHIRVDSPDGRRLVPVPAMTGSCSNAPFALALPTERPEAIRHGMAEGFAFFGGVPAEVWRDNPTAVAIRIGRGRERTVPSRYAAFASPVPFAAKFCLPRTPREKPRVENRVKDLGRMGATPRRTATGPCRRRSPSRGPASKPTAASAPASAGTSACRNGSPASRSRPTDRRRHRRRRRATGRRRLTTD